jgi:hypothetical protein
MQSRMFKGFLLVVLRGGAKSIQMTGFGNNPARLVRLPVGGVRAVRSPRGQ